MPDRRVLTSEAYADDRPISARIAIYSYQKPRLDLVTYALAHLGPVHGPVLDIGSGTGMYTRRGAGHEEGQIDRARASAS